MAMHGGGSRGYKMQKVHPHESRCLRRRQYRLLCIESTLNWVLVSGPDTMYLTQHSSPLGSGTFIRWLGLCGASMGEHGGQGDNGGYRGCGRGTPRDRLLAGSRTVSCSRELNDCFTSSSENNCVTHIDRLGRVFRGSTGTER